MNRNTKIYTSVFIFIILFCICIHEKPFTIDPSLSILVVGNGKSLLGKRLGKVIDSYDCVIRFNCYNDTCCVKDVGEKCTNLVSNNFHWKCALSKRYDSLLFFNHNNSIVGRLLNVLSMLHKNVYIIHDFPNMCKKKCSNGMTMIHHLVENGCQNVSICGFDNSTEHFDGYEWNKSVPHDFADEKNIITKYVQDGFIRRLA